MNSGLREAQIETLIRLTEEGMNIFYIVSDSVSTSKSAVFKSRFPDRFINVGIAEQNLIGIASGLANAGFIPFTGNAAPFLVNRSAEQVKVDISYSRANVKLCGMHTGFSYGLDGITHHEINDVSVMRGFPSIKVFIPCDAVECGKMTEFAAKNAGPFYISLNTGDFPVITSADYEVAPGKIPQFAFGNDITILALGSSVHDALQAAALLKDRCGADIFALTSLHNLDSGVLLSSIKKTGKLLTVEQHSTHGGAGEIAACLMAENASGGVLRRLGIPEGTYTLNASAEANKRHFGLDAGGIAEAVLKMLEL